MNRILVAEDEPRIASFLKKGLSSHGFDVTVVADGPGVHDHAVTGGFDLMVLDIGLPGMDGFDVLRRLRAAGSAIPVIILTARDSVHDTVAGLEGGAETTCASRSSSPSCWPACGCAWSGRARRPPTRCPSTASSWTRGPGT